MMAIALLVYIVGTIVVAVFDAWARGEQCPACAGPCRHDTLAVTLIIVLLWPLTVVVFVAWLAATWRQGP